LRSIYDTATEKKSRADVPARLAAAVDFDAALR
jgi:hypothetical protein